MAIYNLISAKRNADKKIKTAAFQSKSNGTSAESQNRTVQNNLQGIQTSGQQPLQMKQQDILVLQRIIGKRAAVQLLAPQHHAGGIHKAAAKGVVGSGGKLPHYEKIQSSFGRHDVSHVKAYTGAEAAAANKTIGAEAYATGSKVAFSTSNPDLHTTAHEAAHIVQQQAGVQLKGGVGEVGDKYERQADQVADLVVQGNSAEAALSELAIDGAGASDQTTNVMRKPVVQCVFKYKNGHYMSEEVAEKIRQLWIGTGGFGNFAELTREGITADSTFEAWFATHTGSLSEQQIEQINEWVQQDPGVISIEKTVSEAETKPVKETMQTGESGSRLPGNSTLNSGVTKQVMITLDKTYAYTFNSEDEKDASQFHKKVCAFLKSNGGSKFARLTPEVLVMKHNGKELVRSGPFEIIKGLPVNITVDMNRKAKNVEEVREDQAVNQEIMQLVDGVNETVTFSYVNSPSIDKLKEQQNLRELQEALKRKKKLSMALIDPNFATHSLDGQVVAELEKQLPISFNKEELIIGGAKTYKFSYESVVIFYVGMFLNEGTINAIETHARGRRFNSPSKIYF